MTKFNLVGLLMVFFMSVSPAFAEGDSGEDVEEIKKSETTVGVDERGIGIEHREETITRSWEPVSSVSFHSGNVSAGFVSVRIMGSSYTSANLGGGYQYRFMNSSSGRLPDERGGRATGLDFRASALANLSVPDTVVAISGQGSLAWTSYTFRPFDGETLEQQGRGISIGGLAGVSMMLGGYSRLTPILAPFLSFDRYKYNPNTAKYETSAISGFIWPWPFMLSVSYTFSF